MADKEEKDKSTKRRGSPFWTDPQYEKERILARLKGAQERHRRAEKRREEAMEIFLAAREDGYSMGGAARIAGVHPNVVSKWRRLYPDFDAKCEESRILYGDFYLDRLRDMAMGAKGNVAAAIVALKIAGIYVEEIVNKNYNENINQMRPFKDLSAEVLEQARTMSNEELERLFNKGTQ